MTARTRQDLARWVEAGLIDSDQAEAITDFERKDAPAGPGFLAEGLGYVGAALAVGAAALIAQNVWEDLSIGGRLGLIAALAIAMFAGGWALRQRTVPALQRLTDVLWLGGTAAVGGFAALFAADVVNLVDEEISVVVGAAVTIVGVATWLLRRRSLELVAVAGGLMITAIGVLAMVGDDVSPNAFGAVIWIGGAAFLAAGHFRRLQPAPTAQVLGALGLIVGSQTLAVEGEIPGSAVATATAAALVVYAVRRRDDVMLALGGIMVLLFVPQLVFSIFGDSLGAPVALFLTGAALVVIAIAITRARATGRGA